MLKVKGKMWLSVATWRDACFHIVQDNKYTTFIENTAKVRGKGPTLLEGRKKQNRIENEFISSCKEKLKDDIDLECEMDYEGSQDDFFLFPIGKLSTGFPKPSVILIHSRKKLRRIKGKKEKKGNK